MFKGLGNIAQLMKQAQDLPNKMGAINEELKAKRVTGSTGGGMVTVEANGLQHILSVTIDPTLAEKSDIEMIQDLLPAAINDAIAKAKQLHVEAMQSVTGGISIPGMDDLTKMYTDKPDAPSE